ncbi:gephyrin-like molybdotransferase Glp [Aestuariispira insulae]|uniref:Molybdopterin molybdenumtransferase n=1 Tax=Aestuariispira insulae TaxID=1461337 RepID=A0A3D9HXT6_9PROT|nr:gephyrin-like molybdotransferase Glp [Aestuariispira insulae]RED54318.1 molybdopterin molybdochelatase [Aestuariispira insulae]
MAQLSDDCFQAGDALQPLDQALARLSAGLESVVAVETAELLAAQGRTLAEDVIAVRNVPPVDNSAVDGYAVYHADLNADEETRLPVVGRVTAGHPLEGAACPGQAVRIFTGAPMPLGPDTVMMQEDCDEAEGFVRIRPGIKKDANRRSAGEDVQAGQVILAKGMKIGPAEIALLAAQGLTSVTLYKPLKVAVVSSGDEVFDPGSELPEGGIFDANRHMVMAILSSFGCAVTDLGILPDQPEKIRDALSGAAQTHDLLVSSGGMSVGEEDHFCSVIEELGRLDFWRLAIKPGRPVGLGQIRAPGNRHVPVIGLPGNPVAAFTTLLLLGRAVIFGLSGRAQTAMPRFKAPAGFDYKKKEGRREFIRARLVRDAHDQVIAVHRYGGSGAAILSSLSGADGFIDLSEEITHVKEGDMVRFLPFKELLA